jgi:hypothetical protein
MSTRLRDCETARPRTAHHSSFVIPTLPLHILLQFQFSRIPIPLHSALFSICILFRFPSRFINILVLFQHHRILQHLHSLLIPFSDTRYRFAYTPLLLQRHKIPSHYSASPHSYDFYSLIPTLMHPAWIDRWANARTLFLFYPIPFQHARFNFPLA